MSPTHKWSTQTASDVINDGFGIELLDAKGVIHVTVFRCDADRTVTLYLPRPEERPPTEVLDWFYARAVLALDTFEDGSPLSPRDEWREITSRLSPPGKITLAVRIARALRRR